MGLDRYKFENFVKEIFFDSDTKIALSERCAVRRSDQVVPVERPDQSRGGCG